MTYRWRNASRHRDVPEPEDGEASARVTTLLDEIDAHLKRAFDLLDAGRERAAARRHFAKLVRS